MYLFFSFVVLRKDTKELIGVSLNMDLYKEPNIEEITPKIAYIFDFLEYVEAPFRYDIFSIKLWIFLLITRCLLRDLIFFV